jgi:predicted Zn-dependent protease
LCATGCATNPATGKSQLNFYSEASEIEMGRKADAEISRQMGVVDDPALQGYLSALGKSLAAKSERPDLPWSFKVMDDPMVNAFALPGGYIYVTRGILGHLSSEAELASVLGHEIGHVTAQHSMNQMSKAQLAQGGMLVGMILVPEVARAADLAGVGMQALFLKYGRDDERQADELGLRYMSSGGFETREMPKVFRLLGEVSQRAGAGRIPNWLSSHPDPGARANRAAELIAERAYPRGEVNGASYVGRLDGLAFGADPRLGFFEKGVFHHPELRFELRFPPGWQTSNETSRVVALSPEKNALVELSLSDAGSRDEAARRFSSAEGVAAFGTRRIRVGGLDAVAVDFEAPRQQGTPLVGRALFVAHEGRVFEILGIAVQERWRAVERTIGAALESFAPMTERAFLEAKPQRIEIVRLPSDMSFTEFERRYPSDVAGDVLRLLNRISDPTAVIGAGTPLKRVVGRRFGDG